MIDRALSLLDTDDWPGLELAWLCQETKRQEYLSIRLA
jgi:hypothetical protein